MSNDSCFGVEPPRDANGKAIPFDTEILYEKNGQVFYVEDFRYSPKAKEWFASGGYTGNKNCWCIETNNYLLAPPDSFEKIAEDALMDEYSYCEEFGLDYGDDSCPAEYAMHGDLVRRMEAVAARD